MTPQLKALGQRQRDLEGRVGVVALTDVEQARQAADGTEMELVEADFAARQGEDDAVVGNGSASSV